MISTSDVGEDTGGRVVINSRCDHGDASMNHQVMSEFFQEIAEINLNIGRMCLEIAALEVGVKSKYEESETGRWEALKDLLEKIMGNLTRG